VACAVLVAGAATRTIAGCGDDLDNGSAACQSDTTHAFNLREVESRSTAGGNPEIIRTLPGSNNRAVFIAGVARELTLVEYDANGFVFGDTFPYPEPDPLVPTSVLTSICVEPTAAYVVITKAYLNCQLGAVMLVDLTTNPGALLTAEIPVGYNPDSCAFSPDGNWLVVADEDDRIDRPCKPADRHGGSVSIIDVSGGAAAASVVQTIPVAHAVDSEPEGVKVAPDNDTVVITIQETGEYGIFHLRDVPNATLSVFPLHATQNDEPDGLAISDDGSIALISNEASDSFTIISLPEGNILHRYEIYAQHKSDVPDSYNRDERDIDKRFEPEEAVLVRQQGTLFALIALQESHAVIAYNLEDPARPVLAHIAPVGLSWQAEAGGRGKSAIGPEGLTFNVATGVAFTANEREGSITMLASETTIACP